MVEKVFSLSGSAITDNLNQVEKIATSFSNYNQVAVVTGAGSLKKHIEAVKEASNQAEQDLTGIQATRLNARTMISVMDNVYGEIPRRPEEVLQASSTGLHVVMGGLTPGYSTDAVAATVAEFLESDLVIASNVKGVYSGRPEDEDSELLEKVSTDELRQMISGNGDAGGHALIDSTAVNIIERSEIHSRLMKASPENLKSPEGKGTLITTNS